MAVPYFRMGVRASLVLLGLLATQAQAAPPSVGYLEVPLTSGAAARAWESFPGRPSPDLPCGIVQVEGLGDFLSGGYAMSSEGRWVGADVGDRSVLQLHRALLSTGTDAWVITLPRPDTGGGRNDEEHVLAYVPVSPYEHETRKNEAGWDWRGASTEDGATQPPRRSWGWLIHWELAEGSEPHEPQGFLRVHRQVSVRCPPCESVALHPSPSLTPPLTKCVGSYILHSASDWDDTETEDRCALAADEGGCGAARALRVLWRHTARPCWMVVVRPLHDFERPYGMTGVYLVSFENRSAEVDALEGFEGFTKVISAHGQGEGPSVWQRIRLTSLEVTCTAAGGTTRLELPLLSPRLLHWDPARGGGADGVEGGRDGHQGEAPTAQPGNQDGAIINGRNDAMRISLCAMHESQAPVPTMPSSLIRVTLNNAYPQVLSVSEAFRVGAAISTKGVYGSLSVEACFLCGLTSEAREDAESGELVCCDDVPSMYVSLEVYTPDESIVLSRSPSQTAALSTLEALVEEPISDSDIEHCTLEGPPSLRSIVYIFDLGSVDGVKVNFLNQAVLLAGTGSFEVTLLDLSCWKDESRVDTDESGDRRDVSSAVGPGIVSDGACAPEGSALDGGYCRQEEEEEARSAAEHLRPLERMVREKLKLFEGVKAPSLHVVKYCTELDSVVAEHASSRGLGVHAYVHSVLHTSPSWDVVSGVDDTLRQGLQGLYDVLSSFDILVMANGPGVTAPGGNDAYLVQVARLAGVDARILDVGARPPASDGGNSGGTTASIEAFTALVSPSSYVKLVGNFKRPVFILPPLMALRGGGRRGHRSEVSGDAPRDRAERWVIPPWTHFVFFGRLSGEKGPGMFVRAMAILNEDHPSAHGVLIGSGSILPQMRRLALQMQANVTFGGYVPSDRVHHAILTSDVLALVFPSLGCETFGMVGPEAMSQGLPVVTFGFGGAAELIRHRENGLLVPLPTPLALANALESLLEGGDLSERLGRAAQSDAMRGYARAKDRLESFYRHVEIGRRPCAEG